MAHNLKRTASALARLYRAAFPPASIGGGALKRPIEMLESRTMLSTSLIQGDAGADYVTLLAYPAGGTAVYLNAPLSGIPTQIIPAGNAIEFAGNGSADVLKLDYTQGSPIPGGLTIDPSPGVVQPRLVVSTVNPYYALSTGSLVIGNYFGGDTVNFSTVTDFDLFSGYAYTGGLEIDGGNFTFNRDLGGEGTLVDVSVGSNYYGTTASLSFGVSQHLSSLTLAGLAPFLNMLPAGGQVLDVNTLEIQGPIDLANNDLIVNNPTPAEAARIRGLIGSEIFSSTAATDGLTLGYGPASAVAADSLDGQPIPAGAYVVRYTAVGDANLDGVVDSTDLDLVTSNMDAFGYGDSGTPRWTDGDFNGDGRIDSADLALLSANFGTAAGSLPTPTPVDSVYTLTLPATTPLGDANRTDVEWGDGTEKSYPAGTASANHYFAFPGPDQIQMQVVTGGGASNAPAVPLLVTGSATGSEVDVPITSPDDQITISGGGGPGGRTNVFKNRVLFGTYTTGDISAFHVYGQAPTDGNVTVDYSYGDPIPAVGLYAFTGTLTLAGPEGIDPLITTDTSAVLGQDQNTHLAATAVTDALTASGGLYALTGTVNVAPTTVATALPSVYVATGASATFNGNQTITSLEVAPGGTARVAPSSATAALLDVGQLQLDPPDANGNNGGLLDLSNNSMVARNTDASVIDPLLLGGFDSGYWDAGLNGGLSYDGSELTGPSPAAIVSSAAAADPLRLHALGYEQVGPNLDQWTASAPFDGATVYAGDTVVKYTVYGDANMDGSITAADQSLVATGNANGLTGWGDGGFTFVGATSAVDVALAEYGLGFTVALMADATTAPAFTPNGTIKGGTEQGNPVQIDSGGCKGTITITTGASAQATGGMIYPNSIVTNLDRTDNIPSTHNCFWIRLIARTETDNAGSNLQDTYKPNPVYDWETKKSVEVNRSTGATYSDAQTSWGWTGMIRSADSTVASIDQPTDQDRIRLAGGKASTSWNAQEYLVVNGSIVYKVSWTYKQWLDDTTGTLTSAYSDGSGQSASQIDGNPQQLTVGKRTDNGVLLKYNNPSYVKPPNG